MKRTFKITAKEVTKKDGAKFISCSAKIGEKWYRVKFTQDCEGIPKKRGIYDLTVDSTHMSMQKGKVKDAYTENDILWIKEIVKLRKYTYEELIAINEEKLAKVFGDFEVVEPDILPF